MSTTRDGESMSPPERLDYDALAGRVVEGGILSDPWIDGEPRLRTEPVLIPFALQWSLYRAAEAVAAVYNELCLLVAERPAWLDDFFGLTPYQKAMWLAAQPAWHGLARADIFVTDEGLAFTEINSDTPTGEAEAVVLNQIVHAEYAGLEDPNTQLADRFVSMVESLFEHTLPAGSPRTAAILYPTEFTEDLALVRLYRRWFEERGWEVVLGSPFNLTAGPDSTALLFDKPVSVMLRHYKTDWWGERISPWLDVEIPDVRPLAAPLGVALGASLEGRLVIVNPFGAVVPQNKRSMAFMWEHIHRFSPTAQSAIRRHIPVTSRLETMHVEQLLAEKDEWVLKSDYGAEGDEVILGRLVTPEIWKASLAQARPGRWIVQRYFEAQREASGGVVNYGVFLVAGEACGVYTRVQAGPTDDRALSTPVFIAGPTSPAQAPPQP
jgi:glutathionylspermidine synthase